jgi:hypothetical protein
MFSFLEIAPWGGGRLRGGFLENTVRFIQIYFIFILKLMI